MLLQAVVFPTKQPHFSGSELSRWLATVEPVAETLLQKWSHSDASGAMTLIPAALSFGPSTLTNATISLAV